MAGSVTITEIIHVPGVKKIKFDWTSDGSGNVNGTLTSNAFTGLVAMLATVPSGAAAPTDNYDITIVDSDGVDILGGAGIDRDTANTEYAPTGLSVRGAVCGSKLEFKVANAGSAKQGVAYLFLAG